MGVKVKIRSAGDGWTKSEIKIRVDGRGGVQVRVRAFARAEPKRRRLRRADDVTAAMRDAAVRTFLEQGDPVRLGRSLAEVYRAMEEVRTGLDDE